MVENEGKEASKHARKKEKKRERRKKKRKERLERKTKILTLLENESSGHRLPFKPVSNTLQSRMKMCWQQIGYKESEDEGEKGGGV